MTPRVLIAPDKFKGSLTAKEVSAALAEGLASVDVPSAVLPLADGGDGSVDAAVAAGHRPREVTVAGADGAPVLARVAESESTVVVEVANTCGLSTLPGGRLEPLDASSVGFGHAIRHALGYRRARVVLALGGSASTDGGIGMLTALGFVFHDAAGKCISPVGRDLHRIASVDVSRLVPLSGVDLVIAGDVTNPLLGADGAAAVYGPQKGADAATIGRLERGLQNLVEVLTHGGHPHAGELARRPGAGAAGGLGFAALLLGARMVSGASYFLDLLKFDAAVADADLVVTGEGCLDEQSFQGKLVSAVIGRANRTPVVAVAGGCTISRESASSNGLSDVHTLGNYTTENTAGDPDLSYRVLTEIGEAIGRAS